MVMASGKMQRNFVCGVSPPCSLATVGPPSLSRLTTSRLHVSATSTARRAMTQEAESAHVRHLAGMTGVAIMLLSEAITLEAISCA